MRWLALLFGRWFDRKGLAIPSGSAEVAAIDRNHLPVVDAENMMNQQLKYGKNPPNQRSATRLPETARAGDG